MEYVSFDHKNSTNSERMQRIKKNRPKKYGLIWEEKQELVVKLCKEKLPVLVEDKTKEIVNPETSEVNVMIEGDNFHFLC